MALQPLRIGALALSNGKSQNTIVTQLIDQFLWRMEVAKSMMGLGMICLIGLVIAGCSGSDADSSKKKVGTDSSHDGHHHAHLHVVVADDMHSILLLEGSQSGVLLLLGKVCELCHV